jgi:hypothetical protein
MGVERANDEAGPTLSRNGPGDQFSLSSNNSQSRSSADDHQLFDVFPTLDAQNRTRSVILNKSRSWRRHRTDGRRFLGTCVFI